MRIFSFPASYLPSIEAMIQREIRDLDALTTEQKEIFLSRPGHSDLEQAIVVLGALPADTNSPVFPSAVLGMPFSVHATLPR